MFMSQVLSKDISKLQVNRNEYLYLYESMLFVINVIKWNDLNQDYVIQSERAMWRTGVSLDQSAGHVSILIRGKPRQALGFILNFVSHSTDSVDKYRSW